MSDPVEKNIFRVPFENSRGHWRDTGEKSWALPPVAPTERETLPARMGGRQRPTLRNFALRVNFWRAPIFEFFKSIDPLATFVNRWVKGPMPRETKGRNFRDLLW